MTTRTFQFTVTAPPVGGPAWMQGQPLNTWFQIPNSKLSSADAGVTIPPIVMQQNGPRSKMDSWCGGALKRSGSVYIIGAAGGHGDYAGNEVQAITLNTDTPVWTTLRTFTDPALMVKWASVYKDYRRCAIHHYWGLQFVDQDNRLVVAPCGEMDSALLPNDPAWSALYPSSKLMCSFSLDTNDWDTAYIQANGTSYYAPYPSNGDPIAALCCVDPSTGDLYLSKAYSDNKLWKWTRATNSWTQFPSYVGMKGYYASAVDFTRGRILACGINDNGSDPIVYSMATGANIAPATFPGLGKDALRFGGYPGMIYDEVGDRFLVLKNGTPITVYSVDAGTFDVQLLTLANPPAARNNGINCAVRYVPELRGFVMGWSYNTDIWFVRLHSL